MGKKKVKAEPNPGRVLHGKYIGALRGLTLRDKAKVRRIRKEKGAHAAIREAKAIKKAKLKKAA